METPIETITTEDGIVVKLYQDEDAESPRNWDNFGTLVCFHNRYDLGDKKHGYSKEDYGSWDELEAEIKRREKPAVILPVYLYDHSGLRMKVGSFRGHLPQGHAEFDSGQVGFIFVSKADVKSEYGRAGKAEIAKAEKLLQGEIETYDEYLSGQVYGYVIDDAEDGEQGDSCWGFFGYKYTKEQSLEAAKEVARRRFPLLQTTGV